jgi:hypothetical protein
MGESATNRAQLFSAGTDNENSNNQNGFSGNIGPNSSAFVQGRVYAEAVEGYEDEGFLAPCLSTPQAVLFCGHSHSHFMSADQRS